jgi:uncharacterized Zn finger protein (UPF0148 family)
MTSPYYVHGVQVVNVGGELCEACGVRKAIGQSINGHLLCPRCAGWAAVQAEELAAEREASKARRAERQDTDRPAVRRVLARLQQAAESTHRNRAGIAARKRADALTVFPCGHGRTAENTYTRPDNRRACRECRRVRSTAAKRAARERERKRIREVAS